MSLRLVYGRAGSGKSHFCLNDIKSKLHGGAEQAPMVLLVPEQFTLQAEKKLIRTLGTGGIIRSEVLSFRRMAYRVFSEVGGLTRRPINSAGKSILLYRLADGLKDRIKLFAGAPDRQGLIRNISETITELKRYGVRPEDLKAVCGGMDQDLLLKNKLEEIYLLYSAFESTLQERYMDSEDALTELAVKLDTSRQYDGAEVWIDEFSGFTPQEFKVLEKLLQKAARVTVCLCTDGIGEDPDSNGTDVFEAVKSTAAKLLHLAEKNKVEAEKPVAIGPKPFPRFLSKELVHLEGQYFSYPCIEYPDKTEDMSIFGAANIFSEVEKAAEDMVRLARDRGIRYRDMAVVTGNLSGYEKIIRAVFTDYGIPFFIDRTREINDHPLILLTLSALNIFSSNWSYETVFKYLKTGLANMDREAVDTLENYVLACGIRGSRWTRSEPWDFRLEPSFEGKGPEGSELEAINQADEIRLKVITPLLALRSKTRGRKKAREICTALYEFLCGIEVPETLERLIMEMQADGDLEPANEYSQVWNIVMEVFDQIVEVLGEEELTLERFSKLLAAGFGEYKIGLIPPSLDQVSVGTIDRSKNRDITALYILGVNDGVFPSHFHDQGIFSDSDRKGLRAKGLEIAQDTRTKAFEEQFLIYTALTTAGRYLRLSYLIADMEGKTMRPSTIISRIKKIFPHISESSSIAGQWADETELDGIEAAVPSFNSLVSALNRYREGQALDPRWLEVLHWYLLREEWKEKCKAVLSGLDYTNLERPVNAHKAKKLYGSPMMSSISRFEKYASCPFSFYLQYGLKARERKMFSLKAPDLGTFMHYVLDTFSRHIEEEGLTWRSVEREWCEAAIGGIVDQLLGNMSGSVLNSSSRYMYLARRLKRVLTRSIGLIAEHIKRSGFEPLGYEVDFQEGGQYPPIILELSTGEKINLIGRIDRVDTLKKEEGTYLRIIDYKSGSKAFSLNDAYYGLQIQLITYLDAMGEHEGKKGGEPVFPGGILYFKIDDPLVRGSGALEEEKIQREIMKKLKMQGLILANVNIIKEMDRDIDGTSLIIPARLNKGDTLGSGSSAATMEQFEQLRKHVRKLLTQMGEEILGGNVDIKPYKKKRITSCAYCAYASVCQFDLTIKGNRYKIIKDRKDAEVWENMKEKGQEVETDG